MICLCNMQQHFTAIIRHPLLVIFGNYANAPLMYDAPAAIVVLLSL